MENHIGKIITFSAIAIFVYLILRGQAAESVSGATPVVGQLPVSGAATFSTSARCTIICQPLQSSTCAIPLASDYNHCVPYKSGAVSCTSQPAPPIIPVGVQVNTCNLKGASVAPFGISAPPVVKPPIVVKGVCTCKCNYNGTGFCKCYVLRTGPFFCPWFGRRKSCNHL
jgi:hypothetical protein